MADQFLNTIDDYVGLQTASIVLLSLAVVPIVVGSICSLKLLQNPNADDHKKSPSPRTRSRSRSTSVRRYQTRGHDMDGNSSGDDEDLIETIDTSKVINVKDSFLFPIIISGLVYALSNVIETVDPLYVNNAIMILTSILSMTVLSSTAAIIAEVLLPKTLHDSIGRFKFSYNRSDKKLCHLNVTLIHLFIIAVSIGLAVTYALTQHWVIGNMFAISLAIQAIRCLTLDSLGTGYLLLLGMLAYDTFWVFGTDTMEHLSKVLIDAPTSVVWPRNINTYVYNTLLKKSHYFTSFGLGEIIVPGIFIAYCLRIDKSNAWRSNKSDKSFRKPYFILALISYTLTAGASIYTVHFTKQSQSAFLYVVPALILSTLVLAAYRGELSYIWDVSDILDTFKKMNGYNAEEYRPTREERLADRRNPRPSRSVSASARRGSTTGVVEEAFDETRKVVAPIIEEAAEATWNAAEEARKAMTPYYEEAVKNTTRAVHAVATKVQEQTALDEDTTIEEDVVAQHKNDPGRVSTRGRGRSQSRGRGRGRGRSRSTSVAARRSSRKASKKKTSDY